MISRNPRSLCCGRCLQSARLLLNPSPLRRAVLGAPLLALFRRILPQVSQTEQEALDAGTVWWDGDLFSGKPDWNKLLAFPSRR